MKRIMLALAVIALTAGSTLFGQGIDLQKLVQETQRISQGQHALRLVWWIPTEYWQESFRNMPNVSEDKKQEFYKMVDDYIVVCVVDAKLSTFGSVIPTPRDQIISNLSLSVDQGEQMKPLEEKQLSGDAKILFAMMKPLMVNALGQFGQGMEFFCFKGVDPDGKKLIDPKGEGSLSMNLADSVFKWRLPLGSLLPLKYDPQTEEEFPGNYSYNPFTGNKLESRSSSRTVDEKNEDN
jgi:hypothetical protein